MREIIKWTCDVVYKETINSGLNVTLYAGKKARRDG